MDNEFYMEVINLFRRFLDEVDPKMFYIMESTEDLHLQAPSFIIDILKEAMWAIYHMNPNLNSTTPFLFNGLPIEPTYEMAIILFHKEYPRYRHDWMLKKIPLEPPVTLKTEWYTKTIVSMREFLPKRPKIVSDN